MHSNAVTQQQGSGIKLSYNYTGLMMVKQQYFMR